MSGADAASARYRELVALACTAHAARDYAAAAALKAQVRQRALVPVSDCCTPCQAKAGLFTWGLQGLQD